MKSNKLSVILFHLLLTAVPAAALISTAIRPAPAIDLSPASVLSGNTTGQVDALLTENIPLSGTLSALHTRLELLSGQWEVDGIFVLSDRLIENTPAVSEKNITGPTEILSSFAERFDGDVALMLIPTASSINRDLLPASAEVAPQKAVIDKAYELVSEKVSTIDCYSTLSANRDRNIYYRTDPRWTSLGAYMGYSACSGQMGFSALAADRFNIEHASHSFFGSLCDRLGYNVLPDTVDIYTPYGGNLSAVTHVYDGENWNTRDGLYFRERLEDGYAVFPGGETAVTVETNVNGPSLLIAGDSYANALLPFLAMHYSRITLVDISLPEREVRQLTDLGSYDQFLMCCTLNSFAGLQ